MLVLISLISMLAQGGAGRGGAPPSAKQAAPVDLTGYWVAVITEDWKYRMLPANKSDYEGLPPAKPPTHGTRPKILPPQRTAGTTARRISCVSPNAFTSPGRTITP
jgi:hypothetical protein